MNEKDDKYDGQDEGEYHFSDEHAAYEVDTETVKVSDSSIVKESPMANFGKFRRPLIAVGVFFVLMFVVYRVITPNSNVPSGEISPPTVATNTTTTKTTTRPATAVTQPVQAVSAPPITAPVVATAPAAPVAQPTMQPPTTVPAVQIANSAQQSLQPVEQPMPTQASQAPTSPPPTMAVPTPTQAGTVQYDANKELLDRLASLEQQNAKLSNIMQIEYAQKLSDSENQAAAAQAKLKELSTRVAGMEAVLGQITQILQGSGRQVSMAPPRGIPAAGPSQPKQIYTVQAIIPGRAWLKSDAGDTVTVAEGDVLRDYGRVTKIDPYDGVVNIDTGNKTVSLSYGSNGD